MTRYLYDYGLPFSEILKENIDAQIERISNKKASLILIDGCIGSGKTTLAVHIADYVNKKSNLPEINLHKKEHHQLSLGGKEFTTFFRTCHKENLPICVYDEAGDF
jgi:energy-coupling factor transporter ATP-binding protein EcfA2